MDYNNANTQGFALDWDSEIEYTESSFVTLPEGKYSFTVTGFERQNFNGQTRSGEATKIPPCKMAVVHLLVDGGKYGTTTVDERLYLHSSMLWKLSEFFVSIGQMKGEKGETISMNWNAVPGSTGMVEITVNEYTNKNGDKRTNNRVARFLPHGAGVPTQQKATAPQWGAKAQPAAPQWNAQSQETMSEFQRQGRVAEQEKF